MTTQQESVAKELRISADEVKSRSQSGEQITFLDVRGDKAWETSADEIRGAIRVRMGDWHIDPSWSKDRPAVVY